MSSAPRSAPIPVDAGPRLRRIRRLRATLLLFAGCAAVGPMTTSRVAAEPVAVPPAASPEVVEEMGYDEFLHAVAAANLDYAAQRYNVTIAEAQLAGARVFLPNPQLQLGYNADVTRSRPRDQRESDVRSAGLTQPIPIGGKRRARIDAARHALLQASATVDDFWRNLRLTAASAFIDARVKSLVAERKRQSAEAVEHVATLAKVRLKAGDVAETDALQASVDARRFRSDYLAALAEAENAEIGLAQLLGPAHAGSRIRPKAELDLAPEAFDLPALVAHALAQRPDVTAAREAREAAAAAARLARANRLPDPTIGLGVSRTGASSNTVAPFPQTDTLQASLGFELPVFSSHRPEAEAARLAERQAERQLDAALLKVQVEVRTALSTYQRAAARVAEFRGGSALADAEKVLETRRYSYERGSASLVDVLQAQRDLNDLYFEYYDALAAYATARVALEQASALTNTAHF